LSADRPVRRVRLDVLLVERGLAATRQKAQALVLAGLVSTGGTRMDKPGSAVAVDAPLDVAPGRRFVGRGAEKLGPALARFAVAPQGRDALDVGASTGGFTQVLLESGASRVIALDVGRGQLDWSLRNDPRVTLLEGINVRYLEAATLPFRPSLATIDVSFISLRQVLERTCACLTPGADVVALAKPQFEVGRGRVGKGGVVRDPALWDDVLAGLVTQTRVAPGTKLVPYQLEVLVGEGGMGQVFPIRRCGQEVRENLRAIQTLPPHELIRHAVVLIPTHFVRDEILHARLFNQLRQRPTIAKRIGQPQNGRVNIPKMLTEIAASKQKLACHPILIRNRIREYDQKAGGIIGRGSVIPIVSGRSYTQYCCVKQIRAAPFRHPGESRGPEKACKDWIPASAGMTLSRVPIKARDLKDKQHWGRVPRPNPLRCIITKKRPRVNCPGAAVPNHLPALKSPFSNIH
jgi:23S rRNA (cytidine1920-2'-O)/16S rRNA (cytidine1409-2'-O)-methyltransferase